MDENLLTKIQVAEMLGLSLSTVNRFVREKQLPYIRIGRQVRFSPTEIRIYLEQNKNKTME